MHNTQGFTASAAASCAAPHVVQHSPYSGREASYLQAGNCRTDPSHCHTVPAHLMFQRSRYTAQPHTSNCRTDPSHCHTVPAHLMFERSRYTAQPHTSNCSTDPSHCHTVPAHPMFQRGRYTAQLHTSNCSSGPAYCHTVPATKHRCNMRPPSSAAARSDTANISHLAWLAPLLLHALRQLLHCHSHAVHDQRPQHIAVEQRSVCAQVIRCLQSTPQLRQTLWWVVI
jgi:hypothetical protein